LKIIRAGSESQMSNVLVEHAMLCDRRWIQSVWGI